MTRRYLLGVACILLTICSSTAFGAGNFYLGINGGVAYLNDSDFAVSGAASGDIKFDTGFGVGGAVGYDIETIPIRFEGEVTYRKNDISNVTTGSSAFPEVSGDFTALSFMANWYWDFLEEFIGEYPLIGFLLGGVGVVNIEAGTSSAGEISIDSDDTAFAAQLGGGIGYMVTERITIDLSYRFFFAENFEVKDTSNRKVELQYPSHNIFLGVRFSF